jgi:hypothetical protein
MTRRREALGLAAARVRSPWITRVVEAAAYAGTDRLDDGARLQSCSRESPAPWLTSEQNERLAQRHPAAGPRSLSRETEAAVDARAGWKTIEVFVALLPVGWAGWMGMIARWLGA